PADDPRPRRGELLGLGVTGSDGRTVTAQDGAAGALLQAVIESRRPLFGHEVKQVLVAHIDALDRAARVAPDTRALPAVAFDTQIAAYLLNAALRSQTLPDIAAERLGVELLPSATFAPGPRAGIAAIAASAAREPLEQVLFFELNMPKGRRTKTGYSTDAAVLEELRPAHPAIGKILDWRLYTKLKSTYVDALPSLIDPDSGRLHTTFHQAVASTGRLSSSDPNLQNIPIRTDLGRRIRHAFVAGSPDRVLLAADYSQIELRIL